MADEGEMAGEGACNHILNGLQGKGASSVYKV